MAFLIENLDEAIKFTLLLFLNICPTVGVSFLFARLYGVTAAAFWARAHLDELLHLEGGEVRRGEATVWVNVLDTRARGTRGTPLSPTI